MGGGSYVYLSSGWNMLSLFSYAFIVISIVLEMVEGHQRRGRNVAAVASLLIWVQVLYYLRGFRGTGALVRMICVICLDMRYFIIIMIIMTMAFAQVYYILMKGDLTQYAEDPANATVDGADGFAWIVYRTSWLTDVQPE